MLISIAKFILWFLINHGITTTITESKIFEPVRLLTMKRIRQQYYSTKLYELISCNQCTGFWVGMIATYYYSPTAVIIPVFFVQMICNGFIFKSLIQLTDYAIQGTAIR